MSFALLAAALLGALVLMAVGTVIVVLLHRGRGGDFPACGQCGYDVSATLGTEVRCPECGAAFAEVGVKAPGHNAKLNRNATIGLIAVSLLVVLSLATFAGVARYSAARAAQARAQAIAAQAQAQQAAAQAANAPVTANDDAAPAKDDPTGE